MKSYIFWHDDRVEEVRGGNLVDEVSDSLRDVIKNSGAAEATKWAISIITLTPKLLSQLLSTY